MNLFQTIIESAEYSDHAGSRQDLHGFLNVAEMLPGVQAAEQQIQPILGVIKAYLHDALNEKQQAGTETVVQQTVSDLSQPGAGIQEIEDLLGRQRFNLLLGEIAQRLGLDSQVILQFLPALIPVVIKLLAQGRKSET